MRLEGSFVLGFMLVAEEGATIKSVSEVDGRPLKAVEVPINGSPIELERSLGENLLGKFVTQGIECPNDYTLAEGVSAMFPTAGGLERIIGPAVVTEELSGEKVS